MDNPAEPWTNIRPVSTTRAAEDGKIRRPRRARAQRRRQATPLKGLRLYGLATPVTLTLTIRHSSVVWIEVQNHEGRFFVNHDASLYDLIRQVQVGGHWIEDNRSRDLGRTRHT
jgi:hypothetical protein